MSLLDLCLNDSICVLMPCWARDCVRCVGHLRARLDTAETQAAHAEAALLVSERELSQLKRQLALAQSALKVLCRMLLCAYEVLCHI
jgi:hypothetical protein